MGLEATAAELTTILSSLDGITLLGFGKLMVDAGAAEEYVDYRYHYASDGDTINLGEHHIYGSSRLGVQRYDSVSLSNIIKPTDEGADRRTLNNLMPWFSYPMADVIDSVQRDAYADPSVYTMGGNTYLGDLNVSRTLAKRYYELTDHLGNVLATVLDRKTGAGTAGGGTLYDHWSADLASTTDYYPGGFMMPGRNTEYSWSRMGYNGQAKDDEVYGKGNLNTALYWEFDTRRLGRWNNDPVVNPSISPYAVYDGNPIWKNDVDGNTPNTYEVTAGKAGYKKVDDKGGDETDHIVSHIPETKMPWGTIPAKTVEYDVPVQASATGDNLDYNSDGTPHVASRSPGQITYSGWSDRPFQPLDYEMMLLPLPKGLSLFGKGTGLIGSTAKGALGFKTLGGAASKINFYTKLAAEAGYSTSIVGSKVRAGFFVQANHNINRLINGKAMKVLYSSSPATIIGRAWQNQAIGLGMLNMGTAVGAGFYNLRSQEQASPAPNFSNYSVPINDNLRVGK